LNSDIHNKSSSEIEERIKKLLIELEKDNNNIDILMELSSCYRHIDNYDEAILIHDQLLAIEPEAINYLFMKGLVLFEATRDEEALIIFEQILEKDSSHRDAMFNKSLVLKRLGKKAEAKEWMKKALQ
jgi:tetratricopeptide (TPR) repeat protein